VSTGALLNVVLAVSVAGWFGSTVVRAVRRERRTAWLEPDDE